MSFNQTDFAALAPPAKYCKQYSLTNNFAGGANLTIQVNAFLGLTIPTNELIFNIGLEVWQHAGVDYFFCTVTTIPIKLMQVQTGNNSNVRIPYSQTDFLNATPQGGKVFSSCDIFNYVSDADVNTKMNTLFAAFTPDLAAFNVGVKRFDTNGTRVLIYVLYFNPLNLLT